MGEIFIGLGANAERQSLDLGRANRHGLIAGATGTGKTVTLQGMAESFSAAGVPVFVADVKGDLSGIAMAGSPTFKHADKLEARAAELGMDDYAYSDNPAVFWDLYGEQGHPDPHDHIRNGPAAARASARPQRHAGRCFADRLPPCRRSRAAVAQSGGFAGHAGLCRRKREGTVRQIRQCQPRQRGRDPAAIAVAGKSGRRAVLRRTGAGNRRLPRLRRSGARDSSTCWPPTS